MQPTRENTVFRRIAAFVLDTVLVGSVCAALARRRASSSARRAGMTVILASTLGFVYHVALEGWHGQTVGKRVCGLAVVRTDGRPCSFRAATRRTAGRVVDWLPVGYLVGLASIALSDRDQRIGDRTADTVVVRTGEDRDRATE